METIKLLLVDDHKIIRDGVKLMLRDEPKIEIFGEAESGEKALDFIDKFNEQIDLILLDINMPDINGIELTRKIIQRNKKAKILVLTMHAEDNYIQSILNEGALGYILKESGQDELIIAVKTVAEGKKYFSNDVSVLMINSLMEKRDGNKQEELSEREKEVLKLIAIGKTNKEAGDIMHVSNRTVETHRRNIMSKLELHNTAEIVQYAIKHKIIDL